MKIQLQTLKMPQVYGEGEEGCHRAQVVTTCKDTMKIISHRTKQEKHEKKEYY